MENAFPDEMARGHERRSGTVAKFARILSSLPDLALAVTALIAWIAPEFLPPRTIAWILMVMLLEFIVIHSNALMGMVLFSRMSRAKRLLFLFLGGLFYSIFAGGFSMAMHSWWPLISFWMLMFNRMIHVLMVRETPEFDRKLMQVSWSAAVGFYIVAIFFTTFMPLPAFGITHSVISAQQLPGGGLWISKPWTVVVACAMYFAAMGAFEIFWAEKAARKLKLRNGKYRYN